MEQGFAVRREAASPGAPRGACTGAPLPLSHRESILRFPTTEEHIARCVASESLSLPGRQSP